MTREWENKKDQFKVVDARKLTGNFLPGILNKADQLEVGGGICVVQRLAHHPCSGRISS